MKPPTCRNSISVPVATPFDFERAANFYSSRSVLPVGEGVPDGPADSGLIVFTILRGRPVKLHLSYQNASGPALIVSWRRLRWVKESSERADRPDPITGASVSDYVKRTFSTNVRLSRFYKLLKSHDRLSGLATTLSGLKPTLTDSVYDACIWAIVGQQVSLSFARTLKRRIFDRYGRIALDRDRRIPLTPLPESLAKAKISDLRLLQLSENKARYLRDISGLIASGGLDVEQLRVEPIDRAYDTLTAIRGIGKWSANYILMRGAGHLDALPLGDAGLRRAVKSAYRLRHSPDDDEILELADVFRPFRSLYTLYLWQGFA